MKILEKMSLPKIIISFIILILFVLIICILYELLILPMIYYDGSIILSDYESDHHIKSIDTGHWFYKSILEGECNKINNIPADQWVMIWGSVYKYKYNEINPLIDWEFDKILICNRDMSFYYYNNEKNCIRTNFKTICNPLIANKIYMSIIGATNEPNQSNFGTEFVEINYLRITFKNNSSLVWEAKILSDGNQIGITYWDKTFNKIIFDDEITSYFKNFIK